MPGINPRELELLDAQISAQLDLLRHESATSAKVLALLDEMRDQLIAKLSSVNLTVFGKARLNALLKDTELVISQHFEAAQEIVKPSLTASASVGATSSISGLPEMVTAAVPSDKVLESLVSNMLIEGAPSAAWWTRQSQDTAFRFANVVRQGVAQGETNEQIYKRVGEVTDLAGRNSRALVHTSIMQAASDARTETIEANKDIYKGYRHLSTLDSRTCWSKETLILMANGTQIPIAEIQEGDYVIGGVSGEPCKVIGKESTIEQSSVEVCYNGNIIGRTTHAHRALTRNGWQHIGDICLLSDISEREVLCRGNKQSKEKIQGARNESWDGFGICIEQCMEEIRETGNVNSCDCDKPLGSLQSGEAIHCFIENESTTRIQHDGWWGRCSWDISGNMGRYRDEAISKIQERSGIQRKNAQEGNCIWPESIGGEQDILCNTGREGANAKSIRFRLETKSYVSESESENTRTNKSVARENKEELGKSGIQGKSEQGAGTETIRITDEQSSMGCATCREDGEFHEGEMERPGISGKNEIKKASGYFSRSEDCRTGKEGADCVDTGNETCSCRENKSRIGKEEEISLANITGRFIAGEVEIISLAIEGDTSYVAGGIIVHNTDVCVARSNLEWDFNREPIGHNLPWNPPPSHWGCRSVLMGVMRSFKEMGIPLEEPKGRTRSSAEGQIDRETSFDAFLSRRTKAQQDEQLGKGRAELWRSGKITLRQLLDQSGNPLSLEELKAKYG